MGIINEECRFSNHSTDSFTSFDYEKEYIEELSPQLSYIEELSPQLSYHLMSNATLRSSIISMQETETKALRHQPSQTDEKLLRNILAYNSNARRPTFQLERPVAQDQLISDFRHIGNMTWNLICEYSKISFDFASRYDAINAIENYLTRHINNAMLPNIYEHTAFEIKATALATLTKITFSTLSNDPSVSRINGLLHARVCDLLGDAMVKVVNTMNEDDIRHFKQEQELYRRMKELQKLVGTLRWPIDGLQRIMDRFGRSGGARSRQGKFRMNFRCSLQRFQKGRVES